LAERDINRLLKESIDAQDQRSIYRGQLRLGQILVARGATKTASEKILLARQVAVSNSERDSGNLEWQEQIAFTARVQFRL
jgi:hypothetical protein